MSKYTKQDIIDEEGGKILSNALDSNFFLLNAFERPAGKDRYPDIDGQIRLRDGHRNYLNRYLHYQLKSTKRLKNERHFCSRKILDYLVDTNVPTLLIIVDVENERIFWYFLDSDAKTALNLQRDKKGRTLSLVGREIRGNSPKLNHQWRAFARVDDYEKQSNSLDNMVSDFRSNVAKCVGLLYLVQRVPKKQSANLLNRVLGIGLSEADAIINRLHQEEIITSALTSLFSMMYFSAILLW